MFYKKLNEDGTVKMIGTQDELPTDYIEITEHEYKELCRYIKENAVHIVKDIDERGVIGG